MKTVVFERLGIGSWNFQWSRWHCRVWSHPSERWLSSLDLMAHVRSAQQVLVKIEQIGRQMATRRLLYIICCIVLGVSNNLHMEFAGWLIHLSGILNGSGTHVLNATGTVSLRLCLFNGSCLKVRADDVLFGVCDGENRARSITLCRIFPGTVSNNGRP